MNRISQNLFRTLLVCIGTGFLAMGCSNDDSDSSRELASKISLTLTKYYDDTGGSALPTWNRTDRAGIFVIGHGPAQKVSAAPIEAKSPKSLFLFTFEVPNHTEAELVGFYPADAELTCENGILKTTVPTVQTGHVTPCLIGRASCRIGSYEGCAMELKQLFSTLYIRVWGSRAISRAVVKAVGGEAIAGELTLRLQDNAVSASEKTVTVDFPTPLDCSQQTRLIPVTLAPVTLSEGYEVTLTDTDGNSFSVRSTEPVTLQAGGKVDPDEARSPYVVDVVSFNVRVDNPVDGDNVWANRRQAAVTMLEKERPDVMGLQEAQAHQITYLARQCPEYAWYGLGRDTGEVPPETDSYASEECMAIFYSTQKVELLDKGTFWLSETPDVPSKGWDAGYKRSCTWGLFRQKATGKRFYFFNTHLDNSGATARQESIKLIVDKTAQINSEGVPVFLTADFNSDTDQGCFIPLHRVMKDARATAPVTDQEATYNGYKTTSTRRLDHIFYDGTCVAGTFRTLNGNYGAAFISDHYPVKACFVLF